MDELALDDSLEAELDFLVRGVPVFQRQARRAGLVALHPDANLENLLFPQVVIHLDVGVVVSGPGPLLDGRHLRVGRLEFDHGPLEPLRRPGFRHGDVHVVPRGGIRIRTRTEDQ